MTEICLQDCIKEILKEASKNTRKTEFAEHEEKFFAQSEMKKREVGGV